mmetsp:Transcript_19830/g.59907  ORF Transcript_19830/g.59907 Transcript_19830/m.59907 type:complete len:97 (+) Transcript_19830:248-538(+)
MGGGNGQKSAAARIKNQEKMAKLAKGGTSQLKVNTSAQSIICMVCRQTFLCTSNKGKLDEHIAGKHTGKATFEQCFPGWVAPPEKKAKPEKAAAKK